MNNEDNLGTIQSVDPTIHNDESLQEHIAPSSINQKNSMKNTKKKCSSWRAVFEQYALPCRLHSISTPTQTVLARMTRPMADSNTVPWRFSSLHNASRKPFIGLENSGS